VPTVEHVARYPNSHFWDAARSPTADHIKDVMVPTIHPPIFTSFSQANSQRLEMGIIISCLVGIVTCLGECVMGVIGAIVDCLECVISGARIFLRLPEPLLTRGAQRSLAFSRALWTVYVIAFVAGKLSCGFGPVWRPSHHRAWN
jgi:hypothetical protein